MLKPLKVKEQTMTFANKTTHPKKNVRHLVSAAFKKIAPFWPLDGLIAVNPLGGLQDMSFEEAIAFGQQTFNRDQLPPTIDAINRITIKWVKSFVDQGQASIPMPGKHQGLLKAWLDLALHDPELHQHDQRKKRFLQSLPAHAPKAIDACFDVLALSEQEQEPFLFLMLSALPGWASFIQYLGEWGPQKSSTPYRTIKEDYLAIRLIITALVEPRAKTFLSQADTDTNDATNALMHQITHQERAYRHGLLKTILNNTMPDLHPTQTEAPKAQFIFCIDVRSEPYRKALESLGPYETFGAAGFFGLPITAKDAITGATHLACPVIAKPTHQVLETPSDPSDMQSDKKHYKNLVTLKRMYQSLKYNFATPFALAESLGLLSGLWMALKIFSPTLAASIKQYLTLKVRPPSLTTVSVHDIPINQQVDLAATFLRSIGLTQNFAPIVVFCGHGSTTKNNPYASALQCGACAGHEGGINARTLATILNAERVRNALKTKGISIPADTAFIAGQHNTTSDEVILYATPHQDNALKDIQKHLKEATLMNAQTRLQHPKDVTAHKALEDAQKRSLDWAQLRPEWGLARNCAFVIAPRMLTKNIDLEGRAFLHSYDYAEDPDAALLTSILAGPMVVGQWINMQYFFSTLDNTLYGGGSKVTQNIVGKIGVMQGNGSDLMTGLPLQSVNTNDTTPYHELQRLMVVVNAPRAHVKKALSVEATQTFHNNWSHLVCLDPEDQQFYAFTDTGWHPYFEA